MEHDSIPSYLSRLTQAPLLTAEEEVALTRAAHKGDASARQRLIESNMRLVINIARNYRSRTIPLEDLVQEGAIGLMHAAERFDPDKGFRFSTYATHWVRQAIGRAIDHKSKAIRLPAHISQSMRRIDKVRREFTSTHGREPTTEQLAAELGISAKRLAWLMQVGQELLSLDMNVGDSESSTLGNLIRDDRVPSAEEALLQSELMAVLHQVMLELNERERRVLTHRLRHADSPEKTAAGEQLSEELQLSRERIRQIEVQAIKKLRALAERRRIRELLSP